MMTIENVNDMIFQLEGIDSLDEYAYEKALLAYTKVAQLPILIYTIKAGVTFCRTRTHEVKSLFTEFSEIQLPPHKIITDFARCNRPFQPVFYCSENRPTSCMELLEYWASTKKYGDILYITVGQWVLKKELNAILVTTPDKAKRVSQFDIDHGEALDNFIEKQNGEQKDATILFFNYLWDKFRKPAKNDAKTYIITAAYCNLALMHAKGQANAIYYPSVPFQDQGVNFAINSEFMKADNLELAHVIRSEFSIHENENNKHLFKEVDTVHAKQIEGGIRKIIW